MKGLTVGELRKVLEAFPDDLVVTMLHDGKDHHHLIFMDDIQEIDTPYFPESGLEQDSDEFKFLQIGRI